MWRIKVIVIAICWCVNGTAFAQKIEVIKYPHLLEILSNCASNKITLVNFWATWCKPCVEEIGDIDAIQKNHSEVSVILVSLNDREDLQRVVEPFVKKKQLISSVVLLDETDYNAFIDKVDKRWSGAIPATVIVNCATDQQLFYEKQLSKDELESIIQKSIDRL